MKQDPIKRLKEFRKEHGHCNVPAKYSKDPELGRWVARTRYQMKIGKLTSEEISRLDKIGFVWSRDDQIWNDMFRMLKEFRKKQGHCDVPRTWKKSQRLSNWVHRQRSRKKKGLLSAERVKLLESIDFNWEAMMRGESEVNGKPERSREMAVEIKVKSNGSSPKLYVVGRDEYVQYNGVGRKPAEIEKYIAGHGGAWPPYIPLPCSNTEFCMGDRYKSGRKVKWDGRSKLPHQVMAYIYENGVLPPQD